MSKGPLVSIIMSVYNGESSLSKSINSMTIQTYKNMEILIMDDGSTDNSHKILEESANADKRIKVFQNTENIGLTKSLNLLIEETKGDFIARQDADDTSNQYRIEKQLDFMKINGLDASTTRAKIIGRNKIIPNISYFLPKKLVMKYKNPYIHGSLVIKKSTLEKHNNYDEKFYYAQDYKLMSELHKNNTRIGIIKEPLYYLNMKNNISEKYYQEQQHYARCVRLGIEPNLLKNK
tara:strand:- start:9469 stop:10173 length:705 start_codon:yes stop_codon:yes gene_type:complete